MTQAMETNLAVTAGPGDAGMRLDRVLAAALPDLSRARVQALIKAGLVTRGRQTIAAPSYRVKPGQRFAVSIPRPIEAVPEAQPIPLDIVYEDTHLIVIDKPAGLVVHPAAGNPDHTLVNALIAHCGDSLSGIGGVRRPGIVHRLDKNTSGLLVAAKSDAAHRGLARQFADHSLERSYAAVVWGVPSPTQGEIAAPIGRHPIHRKKMAVVAHGGKPARTHYRVTKVFGGFAALVTCRLETGRTHQIRVHMSYLGNAVMGDPAYGASRRRHGPLPAQARAALGLLGRQALHADVIGFSHPVTNAPLHFESGLPFDLGELINCLERL